jgi:ADP-ribosyl-[dinitrogen reductase] hydrolase
MAADSTMLARTWWIEQDAVLAGPYPGAPDKAAARAKIQALLDAGVRTFINLQEHGESGAGGSTFPDYMEVVPTSMAGEVRSLRFPVPDMGTPYPAQIGDVLQAIATWRASGLVYVHCWGGHGRTGTIAGCHMRELGLTADEALAQIADARAHDEYLAGHPSPQTPEQRAVIADWEPQPRERAAHQRRGTPHATQRARARGCMIGQLAGDSLGSLVEFQSPEQIAATYPDGVRHLADGGTWNTLAGQPTDDSELALTLARALALGEPYSRDWVRRQYVEWAHSQPFDIGGATSAALLHDAPSAVTQANGALMRVSPLGIFGWDASEDELAARARSDAAITHPHPVCGDVNVLFVLAIATAIREFTTPHDLYGRIVAWAGRFQVDASVARVIAEAPQRPPADYVHQQGWVLTAFHNALYQLLNASSLEAGVIDTVMRGGDTDTNAAIAGALLGACHGIDAIPQQWRDTVLNCRPEAGAPGVQRPRPRRYWPIDALELADAIVRYVPDDEPQWLLTPDTFEVQPYFDDPQLRRYVRVLRMVQKLHAAGYQRLRVFPYEHDGIAGRIEILPASSFSDNGWRPLHGHEIGGHEFAVYTTGSTGDQFFDWDDAASDSAVELARKFITRFPRLARLGAGHDHAYAGWFAAYVGQIRDFETALIWNNCWGARGPIRVPPPPGPPTGGSSSRE